MAAIKPGTKLKSAVCDTEVMVIKAGNVESLSCGGAPMLEANQEAPAGAELDSAFAEGTIMGKRYTNEDQSFEALCVKPGKGSLSIDGTAIGEKEAKTLPSSD